MHGEGIEYRGIRFSNKGGFIWEYTATHLIFFSRPPHLSVPSARMRQESLRLMGNAHLYSEWRNLLPSSVHVFWVQWQMSALHKDFILNSCACCYVVLLSFTSKVWLHKVFFCQSLDQEMHCVIKNCICYNISFSEIPFWLHLSQNFGSCPKQRPVSLFCAHFCLKTLLGSTEGQLKRKWTRFQKTCESMPLNSAGWLPILWPIAHPDVHFTEVLWLL